MIRFSTLTFALAAFTLAISAGCGRRPVPTEQAGPLTAPVAHPEKRLVTDYVEFNGRVVSMNAVTIVPRVTGYLIEMPFKEGEYVKGPYKDKDGKEHPGDLLFKIDDRPYRAQLAAAKAQETQNLASLKYAKATNLRFKELAKKQKDAVSERELDQYEALEAQAQANLEFAQANLDSAKLNLDWTVIRSPIGGKISRYYLTKGNLVNQDATQLTMLVSMDPIYVYFDMDEPTLIKINNLQSPQGDVFVEIGLSGEEGFPHKGKINFIDNQVNAGTGSISVRGIFKNEKLPSGNYLMTPGNFVRVRMPVGKAQEELLVIDRAIIPEQASKYVYVVETRDNVSKVKQREVTLGSLQEDGLRVITRGLNKDDWVLVGGMQQIRPGMVVVPDEQEIMPTIDRPATPSTKKTADKKKGGKK